MPTSPEQGSQLLAAVLDTALDAVVVMRSDGSVMAWNQIAQRVLGWSAAEAMGRPLSELIIPERLRAAHDAGLQRFLQTGQVGILGRQIETVALRKDGTEIPVELAVMLTGRFQEIAFLGFIRDISARRQAEERIAQLQAELVHVSRVSAMGAMASTLAHELNQPLAAIANYLAASEIALEAEPPNLDALRGMISSARQSTTRAGHIIRRLRDMTAKGKPVREIVDVGDVIDEAAALALIGAEARGVRTSVTHVPGLQVSFDRIQFQQVIINLVRNALEAMEGSERKLLRIAARAEGSEVIVEVRESGPGLSPELLETLFAPFVTSKDEGMGIGLSISRMIVETQHGRIWAENAEDGGTRFLIALPAALNG